MGAIGKSKLYSIGNKCVSMGLGGMALMGQMG